MSGCIGVEGVSVWVCLCVEHVGVCLSLGVSTEGARPLQGVRASLPLPSSPSWVLPEARGLQCPFNAPPTSSTT